MARVVLDTNIILDYLSATRERHQDAADLLEALLSSDDKTPVILAAGIKDAYYILCRHYHDEALVRARLDDFRALMEVAELTAPVLDAAFASDEPDLEDGIVRATSGSARSTRPSRWRGPRRGSCRACTWRSRSTCRPWGRSW